MSVLFTDSKQRNSVYQSLSLFSCEAVSSCKVRVVFASVFHSMTICTRNGVGCQSRQWDVPAIPVSQVSELLGTRASYDELVDWDDFQTIGENFDHSTEIFETADKPGTLLSIACNNCQPFVNWSCTCTGCTVSYLVPSSIITQQCGWTASMTQQLLDQRAWCRKPVNGTLLRRFVLWWPTPLPDASVDF